MDKTAIVKQLKNYKNSLSKGVPINKIILFGSMAKGSFHTDSDIDLIVVSPKFRGLNFFQRGAKMYDYWDLNYPVDFLCYTPEEFNKLKKQITILREAVENGIEI